MNKQKVTIEKLEAILNDESSYPDWNGDNAYQGLQIIAKYFNPSVESIITGAAHDEMWSVDAQELLNRGVTKKDLLALHRLNWAYSEDNENLYCFV